MFENKLKIFIIFLAQVLFYLLVSYGGAEASRSYPEKWYQATYCESLNGETEHMLVDSTRVDCLTFEYAIEFDFANKWAESIGQALHYSKMTGKRAGVVLILENRDDIRYHKRVKQLIHYHNLPISLFKIEAWRMGERWLCVEQIKLT